MAEKPILFNGEMVRAILAGRKTQTRRPAKIITVGGSILRYPTPESVEQKHFAIANFSDGSFARPQYIPGDLLYVRETWTQPENIIYYRADEAALLPPGAKWRPSIHMPKWAARIWLRVTRVRVERARDITDEDAIAEGAQRFEGLLPCSIRGTRDKWSMGSPGSHSQCLSTARNAFGNVWIAIYGPESWDRNDWVWVYEFERTEAPR